MLDNIVTLECAQTMLTRRPTTICPPLVGRTNPPEELIVHVPTTIRPRISTQVLPVTTLPGVLPTTIPALLPEHHSTPVSGLLNMHRTTMIPGAPLIVHRPTLPQVAGLLPGHHATIHPGIVSLHHATIAPPPMEHLPVESPGVVPAGIF